MMVAAVMVRSRVGSYGQPEVEPGSFGKAATSFHSEFHILYRTLASSETNSKLG